MYAIRSYYGSQRGYDLELLKGYGLPKLIDEGENFEFIVISPQCPIDIVITSYSIHYTKLYDV